MSTRPIRSRRAPRADAEATRARIVAVAERLFAERGVDAVSLVEIGQAAGQRNRSVVQYHFRDKAGLLEAIRSKHAPPIERRREEMLDALGAEGRRNLRSLVEVLVRPVADEVRNRDGGAAYVKLNAALIGHPRFPLLSRHATLNPTADRLLELVTRAASSLPKPLLGPRMLLVTGLVFHGIADGAGLAKSRARSGGDDSGNDDSGEDRWELYVRHLVDCVVSVLETKASVETRAVLPSRQRVGVRGPSR
jgi:AcrR family transcriptional regulator